MGVYLKGSDRVLNLANITDPLDRADTACVRGLDAGVAKGSASIVHRIAPSIVADTKIVLVDSDRQQAAIKENDPQNLMRKAIDDHQKITDEQLDHSIKSAFDTGLFTLSEIAFDREHRRAAVNYSFVCGGLCGNETLWCLKRAVTAGRCLKRLWRVGLLIIVLLGVEDLAIALLERCTGVGTCLQSRVIGNYRS